MLEDRIELRKKDALARGLGNISERELVIYFAEQSQLKLFLGELKQLKKKQVA